MSHYWKRLRQHPGLPWALIFSAAFLYTAATSGGHPAQWAMASGFSALMWVTVLWTARTQPLPKEYESRELP